MNEKPLDIERIARVLGGVPRVSYEAPHVYPLSAPAFMPVAGVPRPTPSREPLKLYVHVPFCNYACTFCFYVKQVRAGRTRMERYVAALRRELACVPEGTPLEQLYVGGGTPTALPADLLDEVFDAIDARMPAVAGVSRTVEASPESLTAEHVAVLCARKIERVSMGIETLDPNVLHAINRHHDRQQAENAIALLLAGGLVVNVDFMYGFPGQTEAAFIADLDVAAAWDVPSISVYNLRLNEHTPLERVVGDLERLDLPQLVHWRAMIRREMEARGYEQVRWHTYVKRTGVPSTFGRAPCVDGSGPGRQLGVGVSAVSHLGAQVYRNRANLDEYLTCIEENVTPVDGVFTLDEADRWTLLLVRTLGDGRPLARASWVEAFGRSIEEDLGPLLAELIDAELVGSDGESLFLTDTGRLVYDLITLAFHPHRARRWLAERQSVGWGHGSLGTTS